jgi:TolA-binding protein
MSRRRLHTRAGRAILAVALLAPAAGAFAQGGDSADARAQRLLEEGRQFREEGKTKQALDSFGIIVTGFPSSDVVDNALLEIGITHVEKTGDLDQAREAFEQVATRFPQGDAAPGAYYYLGWLTLSRATTQADLDDALAQFARLRTVYPRSEWVPRAWHGTGLAYRRAGRYEDAIDAERRVVLEYPQDRVAPEALFEVGHDLGLLGRHREAMEEFQRLRNQYPDSKLAPAARNRIIGLYRLYGTPSPSFSVDPQFSVPGGDVLKDVTALLMTPQGVLWVASDKAQGAYPFTDGRMGPSLSAADPSALALGARGELVFASRLGISVGEGRGRGFSVPGTREGETRPLDHITAALTTPEGGYLVADRKQKGIFRFDRDGVFVARFPDDQEREVIRLIRDIEGNYVWLDRGTRSIEVFNGVGQRLRGVPRRGEGYELKDPVDVAVDPQLNAYVADEDRGIWVFSPQGRLMFLLGDQLVRKPTALTVAPDGALIVYDDKDGKVVRLR